MKDFPAFSVVCGVLLVLLFAGAGYGETQSQEQVLGFLDELDRLADSNSDPNHKGHFCKFYEPRLMRSPQEYKRRTVKSFQVPCARGDSIRRCNKYRQCAGTHRKYNSLEDFIKIAYRCQFLSWI